MRKHLLILLVCTTLRAQDITGTITGEVLDPSGARIVGASIALLNVQTGITYTTRSNEAGVYVLPLLPPGEYQSTAQAAGFRSLVRAGITLSAGARLRLDIALEIGSTSDRVNVVAEAPLIQSEEANLSATFASSEFLRLPIGRTAVAVLVAMPGVTQGMRGFGGTEFVNGNINGGRDSMANFQIDGVRAQTTDTGETFVMPILEAVEEVVIQTAGYSAESGHGSTQVNVTTRGGTNKLHGNLFEYFGNDKLNAANFMSNLAGAARPVVRSNNFGGVIGGPVYLGRLYKGQNRTFFSFAYMGGRARGVRQFFSTVPTPPMRGGDFSGIATVYDQATTRVEETGYLRDPFPGNRIPAARVDPIAAKMLAVAYPDPNRPGLANNFVNQQAAKNGSNQVNLRIDHNQSEKNRFTGRYTWNPSYGSFPTPLPGPAGSGGNSFATNSRGRIHVVSAEHTYLFRPNLLNTFRFGYTLRWGTSSGPGTDEGWAAKFGLKNAAQDMFPIVNITGLTAFGGANLNSAQGAAGNPTFSENLLWIKGRHSIRLGAEYQSLGYNIWQPNFPSGNFTFGTLATMNMADRRQGHGFASFLLGVPDRSNIQYYLYGRRDQRFEFSWPYQSAYVQDDIRLSRTVTLNVGLRWERPGGRREAHNWQSSFDFGAGLLRYAGVDGYPEALFNASSRGFQPRFGIAWSPVRRMAVRAGYGIFVLPPNTIGGASFATGAWNRTVGYIAAVDGSSFPVTFSNAFPDYDINAPLGPVTGGGYMPRHTPVMYAQMWSLDIQRQLPGRAAINIGYTGTKGNHLQKSYSMNQVPRQFLGLTPAQNYRPYPNFGGISAQFNPDGNSIYHALQARLERRLSHGLVGRVSYTFSKSIDDASGVQSFRTWGTMSVQDSGNLHLERSVSSFDITHNISGYMAYDLPFGKGRRWISRGGVAGALLGGWNLSFVSSMYTGRPLTMTTVTNLTGALDGNSRPNRLRNGVLEGGQRSIYRWMDVSAFAAPPAYTFGNDSRTEPQLRAPGTLIFNAGIGKQFRLDEKCRLDLRAEANNALNHFNPGVPNSIVGHAAAGTITTGNAGRGITLVMKLEF